MYPDGGGPPWNVLVLCWRSTMRMVFQAEQTAAAAPGTTAGEHGVFGPIHYRVHEVSANPDTQVGQTLSIMRARAAEDGADAGFKVRADRLIGGGSGNGSGDSDLNKVAAIHRHVRSGIRFQSDEATGHDIQGMESAEVVETIIRPRDMAAYVDQGVAVGDCDDFSMYAAALCLSQGIPCAFVTVAADAGAPEQFSHVYLAAYPLNEDGSGERVRVPVDASHGEYPGWETENRFGRREEWEIGAGAGLGGCGVVGMFLAGLAATVAGMWLWRKMGASSNAGVAA